MNYIDNVTLSIFIRLLLGGNILLKISDSESISQLITFCSTLTSTLSCIERKKTISGVNISCNDNEQLRAFLEEYSDLYIKGELIEAENTNESIEALNKDLIDTTKDIKTNKNRYITYKTKFAPLILARYLENKEFIKDLSISLAPEGKMPYPMELYEDNEFGDVEKTQYWQDYFICKYVLDMEWYLDKFNRPVSKTVTVKRRTDYPPQQRKLLNIISNQVKESKYRIDSLTLAQKINLSLEDNCLHSAISRLNKCYKEINNTTTTLIKKNKGTGFYEISREFQPDTEN